MINNKLIFSVQGFAQSDVLTAINSIQDNYLGCNVENINKINGKPVKNWHMIQIVLTASDKTVMENLCKELEDKIIALNPTACNFSIYPCNI